jgi:galactonate dehydratase
VKGAASAREAVDTGMTAVKFDLEQGNDPNRYDRYSRRRRHHHAGPAEGMRRYAPEGVPFFE